MMLVIIVMHDSGGIDISCGSHDSGRNNGNNNSKI